MLQVWLAAWRGWGPGERIEVVGIIIASVLAITAIVVDIVIGRSANRGGARLSLFQRIRQRMPWNLRSLEVLPLEWYVQLSDDNSSVSVTLYVVNYLCRVVRLDEVEVRHFRPDGCAGFAPIGEKLRIDVMPHSQFAMTISRLLADHEARQLQKAQRQAEWRASFGVHLDWHARWWKHGPFWIADWSIYGRVRGLKALPTEAQNK